MSATHLEEAGAHAACGVGGSVRGAVGGSTGIRREIGLGGGRRVLGSEKRGGRESECEAGGSLVQRKGGGERVRVRQAGP